MRSVTHVEPKLLTLLRPDEAVKVLRQLLWAEAAAVGFGTWPSIGAERNL